MSTKCKRADLFIFFLVPRAFFRYSFMPVLVSKKGKFVNTDITINVEHAAKLAQLELTPDETARLDGELRRMVEYCRQKLQAVDVSNVEPTIYGCCGSTALRPDTPQPMLDREDVLQQAPSRLDDEFKVPKIVE
jgi:aspartyl-tRNA(Asn)/glutamyl-tRNA(Gln) amidotransferase subunit C